MTNATKSLDEAVISRVGRDIFYDSSKLLQLRRESDIEERLVEAFPNLPWKIKEGITWAHDAQNYHMDLYGLNVKDFPRDFIDYVKTSGPIWFKGGGEKPTVRFEEMSFPEVNSFLDKIVGEADLPYDDPKKTIFNTKDESVAFGFTSPSRQTSVMSTYSLNGFERARLSDYPSLFYPLDTSGLFVPADLEYGGKFGCYMDFASILDFQRAMSEKGYLSTFKTFANNSKVPRAWIVGLPIADQK